MNFYLHRQSYIDMSYSEYRAEVLRQITPVDEAAEERRAAALEEKYIVLKPKEVTDTNVE